MVFPDVRSFRGRLTRRWAATMPRFALLFIFLLLWLPTANATQDVHLSVSSLEMAGPYSIEPRLADLIECKPTEDCRPLPFSGTASIIAKLDRRGGLVVFDFSISGQRLDIDIVGKYGKSAGTNINGIYIVHAPAYLPMELRGSIAGLAPPYVSVRGLEVEDTNCLSGYRTVGVIVWLEGLGVEEYSYCSDRE